MHPSILALSTTVQHIGLGTLLILGFGFVIFWHELGHFLAAKWVGIKVEQFAVGFGQAVFSWRKGIGFRAGNTQRDYKRKIDEYLARSKKAQLANGGAIEYSDREISQAAAELGLGDTEYRLNWIPLGGYVKMLGQDDLRPDAAADDPRAYNRKSVSARMLVISAGVIMNVILAAIMFVGLFLIGLKASPAWVGNVTPQSPAQMGGLKPGDRVKTFDGKSETEFTKIMLDTALAKAGMAVSLEVLRPTGDGFDAKTFHVTPARPDENSKGFVALGFEPPVSLKAFSVAESEDVDLNKLKEYSPDAVAVEPGEQIVAINGTPVRADNDKDYVVLDAAVQQFGKPVELTVKNGAGVTRNSTFQPHLSLFFDGGFNVAGLEPRPQIVQVSDDSAARDKLKHGDIITELVFPNTPPLKALSCKSFMDAMKKAGTSGDAFSITVIRDGKPLTFDGIRATAAVGDEKGQRGLGVVPSFDEKHATLGTVTPDSPAAKAGLKNGDTIVSIDSKPVQNWYDIHRLLAAASPDADVAIAYTRDDKPATATMRLDANWAREVQNIRYAHGLMLLAPLEIVRKAPNAMIAVKWGVIETRDFILQFYVTIRRMFEGSVALSNMMGPVGIFRGGMKFAFKGTDWLIWFLAMISANLAVVNFLPIPVVDGGQFVFLMLEKIKGKPLSPKTMAIAQYVGLAFLAAVVVFVTYHDILRRY